MSPYSKSLTLTFIITLFPRRSLSSTSGLPTTPSILALPIVDIGLALTKRTASSIVPRIINGTTSILNFFAISSTASRLSQISLVG